jgi:uncharacterized membrane protein YphA (DoxX/SURF4 family)
MTALVRTGRIFFSAAIMAYGTQQIIIRDFRSQIVPGFPAWAHTNAALPVITGIIMIIAGIVVSGLLPVQTPLARKTSLGLAMYFLVLIVASHIPYLLFVYPHKLSHLGSWGDVLKTLAFAGSALVVADTYRDTTIPGNKETGPPHLSLTQTGKVFYCTTIILFGCNHFAYDLSSMVPKWFGMPVFWSYLAGTALVLSGLTILLNIYLRIAALLLATMLFLWVIFLHIPNAIDHPYAGRGNPIVSAFDALMFCGIALILSQAGRTAGSGISRK